MKSKFKEVNRRTDHGKFVGDIAYTDLKVFECSVMVCNLELNSIAYTEFGECKVKTKIAK